MHNLTDEEWKAKKLMIATWEADVGKLPEQRVIREVLVRNANATFGEGCYIAPDCNFFTDSAKLGRNVRVASQVTLRGNVVMGNDVSINPMTNIVGNVKIGDAVRIASAVQIFGFNHGFERVDRLIKDQPITSQGIEIGFGTWIGAGVSIVDGVKIGAHCIVAAGATVTKSCPDFSIIGGTPARILKNRLKETDFIIDIKNLALKNSDIEYCIDLPKTGVLDGCYDTLNGWVATRKKIEKVYLLDEFLNKSISEYHERPDVLEYLKKFRPSLYKHGNVVGFKLSGISKNSTLVIEVGGDSIELAMFN